MDRAELFASLADAPPDPDDIVYLERRGEEYSWALMGLGAEPPPSAAGADVWMYFSGAWPQHDPAAMKAFCEDMLDEMESMAGGADRCRWPLDQPLAPDALRTSMVDYRVTAGDRAAFKRCRRQWDFGSIHRQRLQPLDPPPVELTRAVRDALAVYYYPGMWDWQAAIVLPLVRKAFMRSIAEAPPSPERLEALDLGSELLERYFEWAPSLDDFGPLKIETDVEVLIPDIREPERALLTAEGERILYTERVAMVAADSSDEYWVVVHCVVPEWRSVESLLLDEAAIAACWAWEQTYLGMDVAGTIHNEILTAPTDSPVAPPEDTRTGRPGRGGYSQNEPSGGGRLIPQGQRPDRVEGRPVTTQRLEQEIAGPIRRTRIRRNRAEIDGAARLIGAEVLDMLDPALSLYPTPSPRSCPECMFLAPCVAMTEGSDPALDLATRFREGPARVAYEPRLGAGGGGGRNVSLPTPPSPS